MELSIRGEMEACRCGRREAAGVRLCADRWWPSAWIGRRFQGVAEGAWSRCRGLPLCSRAVTAPRGREVHVRARIACAVRALLFPPHGAGSVRGSPAAPDLAEEPGLAEQLPSPPSALHAH